MILNMIMQVRRVMMGDPSNLYSIKHQYCDSRLKNLDIIYFSPKFQFERMEGLKKKLEENTFICHFV